MPERASADIDTVMAPVSGARRIEHQAAAVSSCAHELLFTHPTHQMTVELFHFLLQLQLTCLSFLPFFLFLSVSFPLFLFRIL